MVDQYEVKLMYSSCGTEEWLYLTRTYSRFTDALRYGNFPIISQIKSMRPQRCITKITCIIYTLIPIRCAASLCLSVWMRCWRCWRHYVTHLFDHFNSARPETHNVWVLLLLKKENLYLLLISWISVRNIKGNGWACSAAMLSSHPFGQYQ